MVSQVPLTDMVSLEFDIMSQAPATVAIGVDDRDHAKFHYLTKLDRGKWKHVRITPSELSLNDDSPVKKQFVDCKRLGAGFYLADFSANLGAIGSNIMYIDNVTVDRTRAVNDKPTVRIPNIIDGKVVEINQSGYSEGDVLIRNGGVLKIRAPRFDLGGNVKIENGKFEIIDTAFNFKNRFPHDLTISIFKKSTLSFRNCVCGGQYPTSIDLFDQSRLDIKQTEFNGSSLTSGSRPGCTVSLDQAKRIGEFLLLPGSRTIVTNSEDILIWYWPLGKTTLNLPDGKLIARWTTPKDLPIAVDIKNSNSILWGLIWHSGADVTINKSRLRAIGVFIQGNQNQVLSNIKNRTATGGFHLTDRHLNIDHSALGAWNLYPSEQAKLLVKDSLFGEAITSDNSQTEIRNSTCDGSGGYISAKGNSGLKLVDCILNCPVAAIDNAQIVLLNCTVNGSVSASGRSTLSLINSRVTGTIKKFNQAKITSNKK